MVSKIISNIEESIKIKKELLSDNDFEKIISSICVTLIECYKRGNKVYFCGNGGSYSDAQHLSAELSGRFYKDREALEVVLLASNISYLTAVANDYSYDEIFLREFKGSFKKGDILVCFTTSGNSENILKILSFCKNNEITTISFLGNNGGKARDISDLSITIRSNDTARIQECHVLLGHSIIEIVEDRLFNH